MRKLTLVLALLAGTAAGLPAAEAAPIHPLVSPIATVTGDAAPLALGAPEATVQTVQYYGRPFRRHYHRRYYRRGYGRYYR